MVSQSPDAMPTLRDPSRRAFALPEALSLLCILATVTALLVLASHDSRRRSRQGCSIDNLRFFASGTQSYAADNADRYWNFSWGPGVHNTEYPHLNFNADNLEAIANQASYLILRYGETPEFRAPTGWLPPNWYSHLPLLEHLGMPMIARVAASPEHAQLLNWQRGRDQLLSSQPRPSGSANQVVRWIYSSSYEVGPAFWSPDAATVVDGVVQQTVYQAGTHALWHVNYSLVFGQRRVDEVRFPASKAHMWDRYQRDVGRRVPFFALPEARVPVLAADGSAGLRSSAYTNSGFNPSAPDNAGVSSFLYQPEAWEPPTTTGGASQMVVGRMRWTRWGLRGRDFNGPEVTAP